MKLKRKNDRVLHIVYLEDILLKAPEVLRHHIMEAFDAGRIYGKYELMQQVKTRLNKVCEEHNAKDESA